MTSRQATSLALLFVPIKIFSLTLRPPAEQTPRLRPSTPRRAYVEVPLPGEGFRVRPTHVIER